MSTRFWDPAVSVAEDQLLSFTPGPQGIGGALFALHRRGAEALIGMSVPEMADPLAVQLLCDELDVLPVVQAVSKSLPGEQAAHFVCDVADRAGDGAVQVFRTAIAKGVGRPIALARAAAIYGVPPERLGSYLPMACDPRAVPGSLVDAADQALLGYVTTLASDAHEVSKADPVQSRTRQRTAMDDLLDQQLARVGQPETETVEAYNQTEAGKAHPKDANGEFSRRPQAQRRQVAQRREATTRRQPAATRTAVTRDQAERSTAQRQQAELVNNAIRASASLGPGPKPQPKPQPSTYPGHRHRTMLPINHTVSFVMSQAAWDSYADKTSLHPLALQSEAQPTKTGDIGHNRDIALLADWSNQHALRQRVKMQSLTPQEIRDVAMVHTHYHLNDYRAYDDVLRLAGVPTDEAQASSHLVLPVLEDGQYQGAWAVLNLAQSSLPVIVDVQLSDMDGGYSKDKHHEDEYTLDDTQNFAKTDDTVFFDAKHGVLIHRVRFHAEDEDDIGKADVLAYNSTTEGKIHPKEADGRFGAGVLSEEQMNALLHPDQTAEQAQRRSPGRQTAQRRQATTRRQPATTRSSATRAGADRTAATRAQAQMQREATRVMHAEQQRHADTIAEYSLPDADTYSFMSHKTMQQFMGNMDDDWEPGQTLPTVIPLSDDAALDLTSTVGHGNVTTEQAANDAYSQARRSNGQQTVSVPVYGDPTLHETQNRIRGFIRDYLSTHPEAAYSQVLVDSSVDNNGELRHDITVNSVPIKPGVVIKHDADLDIMAPMQLVSLGIKRLNDAEMPDSPDHPFKAVNPVVHLYRLENDYEHGHVYDDNGSWER